MSEDILKQSQKSLIEQLIPPDYVWHTYEEIANKHQEFISKTRHIEQAINTKNTQEVTTAMDELGNEMINSTDRIEYVIEEFWSVMIQSMNRNSNTSSFLARSTLALTSVGLWATLYFWLLSVSKNIVEILYWASVLAGICFIIWLLSLLNIKFKGWWGVKWG